jgi:pimeloyl-ACP methyl ester carboxylesterase
VRAIEANGVELCTEAFGDPSDPPVLLIMGIGASMLWWEEGFCRMLAEEIPGAKLLTLEGAGHGVYRSDWDVLARAILDHTGGETAGR